RTLVSNSDAHSPANLGREANLFDTALSYDAMRHAMASGDPEKFLGTIEFFPEEGKYHQDGHRKCQVNLHPKQTIANNGICPVCGAPVTVGVLYRVEQLAGREEGEKPEKTHPYYSLIPLAEILSELLGVGPKSKKVVNAWQATISQIGPELPVLQEMPIEQIKASGNALLAEAISRMRKKEVYRQPGYDGAYGRVTIFTREERDRLAGQQALFDLPGVLQKKSAPKAGKGKKKADPPEPVPKATAPAKPDETDKSPKNDEDPVLAGLNEAQHRAVTHAGGPLLISAGPGTGKTRTLTCRIAHLIQNRTATPGQILAVTFTNKAARQMHERLAAMLGSNADLPRAQTFHAFCFFLLKEIENTPDHGIADEEDRRALLLEAVARAKDRGTEVRLRADALLDMVIDAKQQILSPEDDLCPIAGQDAPMLAAVYGAYQDLLEIEHLYDYEDLLCRTVMHLEADPARCEDLRRRVPYIFIDEYQDLNYAQYRLVRQLCPADGQICVIGDPDQSIYGFRGSDPAYFQRFLDDYPGAETVRLSRSYRSTQTILTAAAQVIGNREENNNRQRIYSDISGTPHIHVMSAESERAEAVAVGKMIEQMVGGMGFEFDNFNKANPDSELKTGRSFADFAVLYRTRAQGDVFAEVFAAAGIPHQRANKTDAWGRPGIAEPVSALKITEGCGTYQDIERLAAVLAPQISGRDMAALKSWGRHHRLPADGLMAEALRLEAAGLSSDGQKHLNDLLEQVFALGQKVAGEDVDQKLDAMLAALGPALPPPGAAQSEALEDLKNTATSFGKDTAGFIETLALYADPDFFRPESEAVSLLTMHAAKGLEFPVVFLTGCEDGIIPYAGTARQYTDPAEERRLFYVALTRAMSELFLTSAKRRRIFGKNQDQAPSPFLADIAEDLKKQTAADMNRKKTRQVQLSLFGDD
ncbi:MAG: UvrD-helicase domain-containing protein, partial [Desulfobacteraceae bacterium]|nr:UvrD-helicase domain-containing protein [Desulfobacteraceae bacterium]